MRITRRALLAAAATSVAFGARAQGTYPNRVIRIVVPAGPGGPTDVFARLIAQRMSATLGRDVIIENRAGAGGAIAAKLVAGAPPDGYTLFLANTSTNAIIPAFAKSPEYDPEKQFAAIAIMANSFHTMVVRSDSPVKSVKEFIALAKSSPKKLDFGSAGHGNLTHLAGELFKLRAGIDMIHVPYKSAAEAATGILGGQVYCGFGNLNVMLPHIRAGSFRALAVTSETRSAEIPEVPTMIEAGVPDYVVTSFFGLAAPAGLDPAIVKMLNSALNDALKTSEVQQSFTKFGADTKIATPQEFAALISSEYRKWSAVAKVNPMNLD
ncbi:MAG: tripartite tricarboxylate transporter substrate binding protein [Pseudomonadota bacterium]